MLSNIDIFIGTYDSYLLSYRIIELDKKFQLQKFISQQSHISSVRTVNGNKNLLATGGSDDRIVIYDLKQNKEIQMLTHHTGTVNQIAFSDDKYLFSISDDGTMAVTKTGSWMTERVWQKPHTGKPITHIAIHPRSKLAFTLGKDNTLRTWDLVKGQQHHTTNLKKITKNGETIEQVDWSPCGKYFSLIAFDKVLIMSFATAAIVKEIRTESRPVSVCWISSTNDDDDDEDDNDVVEDTNIILVGQINGNIQFTQIVGDKTKTVKAHDGRVKAMATQNNYLVTVSSNVLAGEIRVWELSTIEMSLNLVCSTPLSRRPICLTLLDSSYYRQEPLVKTEDEADSSDGEEVAAVPPKANTMQALKQHGTVTIEKEEEDYVTPKKQQNLKRKQNKNEISQINNQSLKSSSKKKKKTSDVNIESSFTVSNVETNEEESTNLPPKTKKAKNMNFEKIKKKLIHTGDGTLATTTPVGKKQKRMSIA